MNKQQLAAKIWESANQMRSKIEANEYKDYILGFIFYKYLSDKELKFLKEKDFDVSNVRDALSAFNRLINPSHKKVFEGVFDTLQTGLSKLGDSSGSQTKA